MKKWVPKTASKKGAPPDSNETLSVGQEAPGEAASRARCTDKKQLFDLSVEALFEIFVGKKIKQVDWAQNGCENLLDC